MAKRRIDAIGKTVEKPRSKRPARSASPTKPTRESRKSTGLSTTTAHVEAKRPATKRQKSAPKLTPGSPSDNASDSSSSDVDPILIRYSNLPKLVKNPIPYAAPLDFLTPCPWVLPTKSNAITKFNPNMVTRDALETRVILHPRLPMLITAFLKLKLKYGSEIEKRIYNNMSQHDLVGRLVENCCLHFGELAT